MRQPIPRVCNSILLWDLGTAGPQKALTKLPADISVSVKGVSHFLSPKC